ncbi:hypothetical protein ABZX40_22815 [Streptomyces sp. NPDC004610]
MGTATYDNDNVRTYTDVRESPLTSYGNRQPRTARHSTAPHGTARHRN